MMLRWPLRNVTDELVVAAARRELSHGDNFDDDLQDLLSCRDILWRIYNVKRS